MGPQQQPRNRKKTAHLAFGVWLVATVAFLAVVWTYARPSMAAVFASLEVDLPRSTIGALWLGAQLRTAMGMTVALGIAAAIALPFVLGARGRAGRQMYWTVGIIMILASVATWASTELPIRKLQQKLDATAVPSGW